MESAFSAVHFSSQSFWPRPHPPCSPSCSTVKYTGCYEFANNLEKNKTHSAWSQDPLGVARVSQAGGLATKAQGDAELGADAGSLGREDCELTQPRPGTAPGWPLQSWEISQGTQQGLRYSASLPCSSLLPLPLQPRAGAANCKCPPN